MTPTLIDSSLYSQFADDQLAGINVSNVGDLLRAGTDEWQNHSDAIFERFETTENQQALFKFVRMLITESDNIY